MLLYKKCSYLIGLILIFLFNSEISFSQSLNHPESIVYSESQKQYFISNAGNGQILSKDANGVLKVFAQNIEKGPHGMEIVGDTLFVCAGSNILGYDLKNGKQFLNNKTEAKFLNGITYQNNYLYATDFLSNKIFKISILTGAASVFLEDTKHNPNGIHFDLNSNSLIYVTWGKNAKVMSVSLKSKELKVLLDTEFENFDGICQDFNSNFYISSWGSDAVFVFDKEFSKILDTIPAESPADIYFCKEKEEVMIPSFNGNKLEKIDSKNAVYNHLEWTKKLPNVQFFFDNSKNCVQLKDENKWSQYFVYNSSGVLIDKGSIAENLFEIQKIEKGMYIVKCTLNEKSCVLKFYKI